MNIGRVIVVVLVAGLVANTLHGQPYRYTSPNDIPRGTICFFDHAQNPRFLSNFMAETVFGSIDDVHALLNPLLGMQGLAGGQNAYIVQVAVDGTYRLEVEVELPPIGPSQRAIAFPVFPDNRGNRLPRLAAAMKACLESARGRHRYTITVFLKQNRLYLGTGEFYADGFMGQGRLDAVGEFNGVATENQDSAVAVFIGTEMARDFPHLEVVRIETVEAWHDEPTWGGPIKVCTVRYSVKAREGDCFQGYSVLRRVIRKNKELGRVLGDVWPNLRGDCGKGE